MEAETKMNEEDVIQIIAKKWIDVMGIKISLTKHDREIIMKFAKDCDTFIKGEDYVKA